MNHYKEKPRCSRLALDCKNIDSNGYCRCLQETNFNRLCPFYKTAEKYKKEQFKLFGKVK